LRSDYGLYPAELGLRKRTPKPNLPPCNRRLHVLLPFFTPLSLLLPSPLHTYPSWRTCPSPSDTFSSLAAQGKMTKKNAMSIPEQFQPRRHVVRLAPRAVPCLQPRTCTVSLRICVTRKTTSRLRSAAPGIEFGVAKRYPAVLM
jgi:hypothetical protein